jgi:hypothetical protein
MSAAPDYGLGLKMLGAVRWMRLWSARPRIPTVSGATNQVELVASM